ncbi:hypothetical protein ONS95_011606 [Cadophora gregata]|uniref:uncharacterized protein n=1 Tax=Cadophora gregata TaxID=51156 RepID=UPI0026DD717B|nr:uncharacterized protein ONS95_011606 [Cadophora gregata]KAK0120200.1 hypothetical protein ONS95_011606 [Cadophora gregata]KAK0121232.1 hypothetical protein ONS96_011409 [Cadophora gregata f. sp. sojae]
MQFSTLIKSTFAILALTQTAIACSGRDQDCCWNDFDGCVNQHGQFAQSPCTKQSYQDDFCANFGVNCDGADCCSISTGKGRGCP